MLSQVQNVATATDSLLLHGPAIESRWVGGGGARSPAPVQAGPETHASLLYSGVPRVKWQGRGVNHAPRLKKE
jgi:hypothetical protein